MVPFAGFVFKQKTFILHGVHFSYHYSYNVLHWCRINRRAHGFCTLCSSSYCGYKRHSWQQGRTITMKYSSELLITLILLFSLNNMSAYAQTQEKYYSDLFHKWGFNTTIFYTDSFAQNKLGSNRNIVVICNDNTSLGCSYNQKNGVVFNNQDVRDNQRDLVFKTLEPIREGGRAVYYIPQILLTYPKYQELVEAYFKSVGKANESLAKITDNKIKILIGLDDFKQSVLFQGCIYSSIVLFMGLLLGKFIRGYLQVPSKLSPSKINSSITLHNIGTYAKVAHKFSPLLFLFLILFYLLVVTIALARWQTINGLVYAIKLYIYTFIPSKIYLAIVAGDKTSLILATYNFILCSVLLFIMTPNMMDTFRAFVNKTLRIKIQLNIIKWGTLFVTIVATLLISLDIVTNPAEITALVITWFLLLIAYLKSRGVSYYEMYSNRGRLVITVLLAFIAVFSVFWETWAKGKLPPQYNYQPLFSSDSKVITSPYLKEIKQNVLFLDEKYAGDSLLFVNNYLIYHPMFKKISIKNISSYSQGGSFIVVAKDQEEFIKEIITKPGILENINSTTFSPLFTIKNFNYKDEVTNQALAYDATITLNCGANPKPVEVVIDAIYSTTDPATGKTQVESKDYTVLDFPGCRRNEGKELFMFPFPTEFASRRPTIAVAFKIAGINDGYIDNIKILSDGTDIPISYFQAWDYQDGNYNLAYAQYVGGDEINAYSIDPVAETSFNRTEESDQKNLSVPINSLIKRGTLGSKFLIWSYGGRPLVKTNYD